MRRRVRDPERDRAGNPHLTPPQQVSAEREAVAGREPRSGLRGSAGALPRAAGLRRGVAGGGLLGCRTGRGRGCPAGGVIGVGRWPRRPWV